MKNDNYTQAKEIMKLFNIEDDKSSKAARFAEEYENSFQKLTVREKSNLKTSPKTIAKKTSRLSVLKNVASVAAAGVASTSNSSIVENLLLSSNANLKSSDFFNSYVREHFVHALVCFDFLCTGCFTKESSINFLVKARNKFNSTTGMLDR